MPGVATGDEGVSDGGGKGGGDVTSSGGSPWVAAVVESVVTGCGARRNAHCSTSNFTICFMFSTSLHLYSVVNSFSF